MHPPEGSAAYADYDIGGFFSSLTFAVGINDDVEFSISEIVFQVCGVV